MGVPEEVASETPQDPPGENPKEDESAGTEDSGLFSQEDLDAIIEAHSSASDSESSQSDTPLFEGRSTDIDPTSDDAEKNEPVHIEKEPITDPALRALLLRSASDDSGDATAGGSPTLLTQLDVDSFQSELNVEDAHTLSRFPKTRVGEIEKERIEDVAVVRLLMGPFYDRYIQTLEEPAEDKDVEPPLLDQSQLDAILASHKTAPKKEETFKYSEERPEIEKEPIEDPALLNKLLRRVGEIEAPTTSDESFDQSAVDTILDEAGTSEAETVSEDEVGASLTNASDETSPGIPDEASPVEETGTPVSQSDIDALLSGPSGPLDEAVAAFESAVKSNRRPSTASDSSARVSGSEGRDEPASESPGEEGAIDQSAIDALLAGPSESPDHGADKGQIAAAKEESTAEEPNLQKAASEQTVVQAAKSEDVSDDQSDIDALVAGEPEVAEEETVEGAPAEVGAPVDQSQIDALLAEEPGESDEEGPEATGEDAPEEAFASLDQSQIDPLQTEEPGGLDEEEPEATVEDAPAEAGASVDQSEIDALLAGSTDDQESILSEELPEDVLGEQDMEERLDVKEPAGAAPAEAAEDVEDLLSELVTPPEAKASASTEEALPLAEVSEEEPGETDELVGSENVVAAGASEAAEEEGLSQDLLEQLLTEAKGSEEDAKESEASPEPVEEEEPVSEPAPLVEAEADEKKPEIEESKAKKAPREPSMVLQTLRTDPKRIAGSLAAGLVAMLSLFTYLYTHQLREVSDFNQLTGEQSQKLARSIDTANRYLATGDYPEAVATLEEAIKDAPVSMEKTDAEFLLIEAQYLALPSNVTDDDVADILNGTDRLLEIARGHPQAAQTMYLKAKVYEAVENPIAARATYLEILRSFGRAERLDQVLMELGVLELNANRPEQAELHFERMLDDFPSSPLAGRVEMYLGDALALQDRTEEAKRIYARIARSAPHERIGAQAYGRLGQLAFNAGNYEEAIRELETRAETSTTVEGNDSVYLLLAKAYRANDQPEDARNILNDLLEFFPPDSPVMPEAHVELSRVLNDLGMGREAVRFATQTVERFPDNPLVLKNEGELLAEFGDVVSAGRALMAAHRAGASDPGLLLAAGRHFRKGEDLRRAREAFDELRALYPSSEQALEGSIERALVHHAMGETQKGLELLEDLVTATESQSRKLRALDALGNFYQTLGLKTPVREIYGQIAALTTEDEMIAKASMAMLNAKAWDEGLTIASRVDRAKLRPETGYAFLMKQGETLMLIDAQRGLAKMEQAFDSYPEQRTEEGDLLYLKSNLTSGRRARARAIVEDIEMRSKRRPLENNRLEEAAITLGDYLLDRGDFRAAADAYAKAIPGVKIGDEGEGAPRTLTNNQMWAMFQRASALHRGGNYRESLPLYDFVGGANSRWAKEADAAAAAVRIELRLRGEKVAPADGLGS